MSVCRCHKLQGCQETDWRAKEAALHMFQEDEEIDQPFTDVLVLNKMQNQKLYFRE